ncbi:PEGA domain-containing protein [Spirochaeta africana]|uniref:PEGA domain-containing protein n=1 Tax=Spirochaeta africana (strain ATCC 700263 / DSM 8902 / Z-7692) TaxID=889378 RepID=H9UHL2_SPIAZ|nr:PEGA domain-containing protein [Spirochaeta africana]AFG37005.1 PEGA domain-containing protein [Spirochaeta africana DSM 8902]
MKNTSHKVLWISLVLMIVAAAGAFAQTGATGRTRSRPDTSDTATHQLTVRTNPGDAMILVNGQERKSNTMTLEAGNYTVEARAPGYESRSVEVNLNWNQTITINLQREVRRHSLRVITNVSNAVVYLDGDRAGSGEFATTLDEGRYSLRITAPGYQDHITQVELDRNRTVRVALEPRDGTVILDFPQRTANVFYFIDGNRSAVNSRRGREEITLSPGTYSLRFEAGGISSSEIEVDIRGGERLRIVPTLGFEIESED